MNSTSHSPLATTAMFCRASLSHLCYWLPSLGILEVNYQLMRPPSARRSQTQVLSASSSRSSSLVTSKGKYSIWLFRSFTINSVAPSTPYRNLLNRICAACRCLSLPTHLFKLHAPTQFNVYILFPCGTITLASNDIFP